MLSPESVSVKTVLDSLPCAIALWNWEHSFCWLNLEAKQLLGFSDAEVHRDPSLWLNRIYEQDRALFSAAWERLRRGAQKMTCDYRFFCTTSQRLSWLREIASPVKTAAQGAMADVLSLYFDITDLHPARDPVGQEAHVPAGRPLLIDALMYEVLHTLQNLSIGLELLRQTPGDSLERQAVFQRIERASHLVREMREQFSLFLRRSP